MEAFPEELRTPPLGLVLLVGLADLHSAVADFLRTDLRPPLNTVGAAEAAAVAELVGEPKAAKAEAAGAAAGAPPGGILKAGWLLKHRARSPCCVVLLLEHAAVLGDPNAWVTTCGTLDTVRAALRASGLRLVIATVAQHGGGELPEDRAVPLRRCADVDARCVVTLSQDDLPGGLRRLGKVLHELAAAHYREEGAKAAARLVNRAALAPGLAVRHAFKAAVYAEFRQDWAGAVKFYRLAYKSLCEDDLPASPGAGPLQQVHELLTVAEQLHLKLCMLLLHSSGVAEAAAQARAHTVAFRRPPAALPHAAAHVHWGWLVRQHRTFAELLQARAPHQQAPAAGAAPVPAEHQPAYHFHAAAAAAIERRRSAQASQGDEAPQAAPDVAAGSHVGRLVRTDGKPLSDDELLAHLLLQENPQALVRASIELLTRTHEAYKSSPGAGSNNRTYAALFACMAEEYLHAGDYQSAWRLLSSVAGVYRRERWEVLLAGALRSLRSCARHLNMLKEHAELSLELAGLAGAVDADERVALFTAAMATLQDESAEAVEYTVGEGSSLARAFTCLVGFTPGAKRHGETATLGFALHANLPLPVPIERVEVCLANGGVSSAAPQTLGAAAREASRPTGGEGGAVELAPRAWQCFSMDVELGAHPRIECVAVVAEVGKRGRLRFPVQAAPRGGPAFDPMSSQAAIGASALRRATGARVGLHSVDIAHAVPQAELTVQAVGPAVCGELFSASLVVTSTGDELRNAKLELGLSVPGEDAASITALPVDLLRPGDGPDDPPARVEAPLAVPALSAGASHVARVLLKWHEPGQKLVLSGRLMYEDQSGGAALLDASVELYSQSPLRLEHRWLSSGSTNVLVHPAPPLAPDGSPCDALPADQPVMLSAVLHAEADVALRVRSVALELAEGAPLAPAGGEAAGGLLRPLAGALPEAGATLDSGEALRFVFPLRTAGPAAPDASAGALVVAWEREQGDGAAGAAPTETRVPLQPVAVAAPLLSVGTRCPARVTVGEPFELTFDLRNATGAVQDVTVSVADSAGFVFAGERRGAAAMLPRGEWALTLCLVAILAGEQPLPEVKLAAPAHAATLALPPHLRTVFVHPAA